MSANYDFFWPRDIQKTRDLMKVIKHNTLCDLQSKKIKIPTRTMRKQILMLDSKSKDLKFETHVDQSEPGEVLSQSPDMSSTRTKLTIRSSSRESSQSQNDQVIRTPM